MVPRLKPCENLMPSLASVRITLGFMGVFVTDRPTILTDTFMSKTARLYQDTRTANAASSGLDRLNDDLQDVTRIMTKNMEELLWRGDSLDRMFPLWFRQTTDNDDSIGMSHLSTSLRSESEKYRKAARNINLQAMLRQYAPFGAVGLLVLIMLYWRFM